MKCAHAKAWVCCVDAHSTCDSHAGRDCTAQCCWPLGHMQRFVSHGQPVANTDTGMCERSTDMNTTLVREHTWLGATDPAARPMLVPLKPACGQGAQMSLPHTTTPHPKLGTIKRGGFHHLPLGAAILVQRIQRVHRQVLGSAGDPGVPGGQLRPQLHRRASRTCVRWTWMTCFALHLTGQVKRFSLSGCLPAASSFKR